VLLFLIAVDYGRMFYYSQIVANCARNGSLYACDPYAAIRQTYADVDAAARADAPSPMNTELTVNTKYGTDTYGDYVTVTVGYTFTSLTKFPGVPSTVNISFAVTTRVAPAAPL